MNKAIATWSGGKDSCLACYKALVKGYEIRHLINTISTEYRRVRFHGTESKVIQMQAAAIGIDLLQKETTGDDYEREFKEALADLVPGGIDSVVFGDIHLQHCRQWAERICSELGVRAIEPLWGRESEEIVADFIESGFEAVVVSTQANLLGEEWVGRRLDRTFLEDIKGQKDIDICGENGEYHTLVVDGPIFKQRIDIIDTQRVHRDGYWFLDIRKYQLMEKETRSTSA